MNLLARTVAVAIIVAGSAGYGGPAWAQVMGIEEIERLVFAEQDANGDGMIGPEEVVAFDERMFATADANTDGFIDEEEFVVTDMGGAAFAREQGKIADYENRKRTLMAEIDESGDGRVSRGEFLAAIFESFREADADENARIDQSEFSNFTIVSDGMREVLAQ